MSDPENSPGSETSRPSPSTGSGQGGIGRFWIELRRRKVVRVALTYLAVAWLLIEVTATVFPQLGMPDWAPTLVTLLFIIGFPITVILAWIFDVTPEGIKTTQSLDGEGVPEKQPRKSSWLPLVFAAGLPTLIFGALAFFFYLRSDPTESNTSLPSTNSNLPSSVVEKSIAVLPLVNMSPDPDNAFFADGVQEEILTNLAKIHDLLVIGRTSTLRYRDTTKGLSEIGRELNVRYLLEGSVQRAGDQVRVTVQLIETDTEGHLWAESYTRELDDFFSIISSISKEIAGQLQTVLSPEEIKDIERPPTENQEAYDLLMRTRQGGRAATITLLERAVELDPDFYQAWFTLSFQRIISWRVDKNRNDTELYQAAYEAMRNAERLARGKQQLGFIEALKGVFAFNEFADLQTSLEYELRANAISPDDFYNIPWRYLQLGQLEKSQQVRERQIKGRPFTYNTRDFNVLLYRRNWDEAREYARRGIETNFDDPRVHLEGRRNLMIIDYLETGNKKAFYSSSVDTPTLVDSQFRYGLMNDNYKIRDALLARAYSDALSYLEEPDPYPNFSMLDGTLNRSPNGRWRLWVEPLDLLIALIHFELEDREEWMTGVERAKTYLYDVTSTDAFADPDYSSLLAICYALEGDEEGMKQIILEVREKTIHVNYQFRFQAMCEAHFAMAYVVLGDHDKAIEILESASKLHSPIFLNRELDLWFIFDRLKGNPRFDALLQD